MNARSQMPVRLTALLRTFIALAATLLLTACAPDAPVSRESYVFGTRVEVLVWGQGKDAAETAIAEVLREFDRLHRTYHAWEPSELYALNQDIAAGKPHKVSPELAGLIRESQALSAQGDHLFDPGIGNLVALWGFHSDEFKPVLPDPAKLAELKQAHPSIADLTLDGDVVTSRNRAVALDFGGYLKGVALDRAAAILRAKGIHNALINIGGNVMALGSKGGVPWRVGIQHPRAPAPLATLELRDGEAIGTSGDYQRFFELGGRRYCHLIDPRSGEPSSGTQAVTVLVPAGEKAGMFSDESSKPLFIAGADWPRLAAAAGQRQVLRIDAEGKIQVTAAMRARLTFEVPDLKIEELP
jgi:FAD:protein FMN transferase